MKVLHALSHSWDIQMLNSVVGQARVCKYGVLYVDPILAMAVRCIAFFLVTFPYFVATIFNFC